MGDDELFHAGIQCHLRRLVGGAVAALFGLIGIFGQESGFVVEDVYASSGKGAVSAM